MDISRDTRLSSSSSESGSNTESITSYKERLLSCKEVLESLDLIDVPKYNLVKFGLHILSWNYFECLFNSQEMDQFVDIEGFITALIDQNGEFIEENSRDMLEQFFSCRKLYQTYFIIF